MASSTAFSCFRSSSRRESVLLGLEAEPEPADGAELGAVGLAECEGGAAIFPEDLGGGDKGRFLRKMKTS